LYGNLANAWRDVHRDKSYAMRENKPADGAARPAGAASSLVDDLRELLSEYKREKFPGFD